MIDFNINNLIDKTLGRYFESFELMLDTADYVSVENNRRINKFIGKCLRRKFREIKREDRRYQRTLAKLVREGKIVDPTSEAMVLLDYMAMGLAVDIPPRTPTEVSGTSTPASEEAPTVATATVSEGAASQTQQGGESNV